MIKIEIGDKVRFLNEVGGGTVTRIEGTLVFVEDSDGFEIPVPVFETVVVEKASGESIDNPAGTHTGKIESGTVAETEPELGKEIFEDETLDDSEPRIYLAFITASRVIDAKSKLHVYLVNDSNYFCSFIVSELNDEGFATLLRQGIIEPNTKLMFDEKEISQFDAEWTIQLMLFKKGKAYQTIPAVSTSIKLNPKRFFKRNAFEGNDFFYQSAHLISLIKNEFEKKIEILTDDDTNRIILEKETNTQPKTSVKRADTKELLEIDLHIHELLDDTRGLSNAEMLNVQLDKFNAVMEANKINKGRRIVFIHGVGNGTLKTELRKQLDKKYRGIYYQDASFKEYGFGATMVVI